MKKEVVIIQNIKQNLKNSLKSNDMKITKQNISLILKMYQEEIGNSINETGSFKINSIGILNKSKRNSYNTVLPDESTNTQKSVFIPAYNTVYFQTDKKLKRKVNS